MPRRNPYIAGKALSGLTGFWGRDDVLREVEGHLARADSTAIVLFGQRRIGKTSILLNLRASLPSPPFITVYFDLMDRARKSLGEVLFGLASDIAGELNLPQPERAVFDDAGAGFRGIFLPAVYAALGEGRRLVLLFDEFDVLDVGLEEQLPAAAAARAFFPYLRELMAREPGIGFVFVVGRKTSDLSTDFKATFKAARYFQISVLDDPAARELVETAQRDGSLTFEPGAVARVLALTSNHPYFTQLLCQLLFDRAYASAGAEPAAPPVISVADVESVVDKTFERGENVFEWIWEGLPPAERIIFAAVAQGTDENTVVTEDRLIAILQSQGMRIQSRELELAPKTLVEWQMLKATDPLAGSTQPGYRFFVELLRRWVADRKPLTKVKDELDRINPLADSLYQSALGFARAGQLDPAIDQIRLALGQNPNHVKARRLLADVYLQQGKLDDVVRELSELYRIDQGEGRVAYESALLRRAESREREGRPTDALADYDRALDISPANRTAKERRAAILLAMGEAALAAGALADAKAAFEKAGATARADDVAAKIRRSAQDNLAAQAQQAERADEWDRAGAIYTELLTTAGSPELMAQWMTELKRAEREEALSKRYAEGISLIAQKKWPEAQSALAGVVQVRPDYKDARAQLERTTRVIQRREAMSRSFLSTPPGLWAAFTLATGLAWLAGALTGVGLAVANVGSTSLLAFRFDALAGAGYVSAIIACVYGGMTQGLALRRWLGSSLSWSLGTILAALVGASAAAVAMPLDTRSAGIGWLNAALPALFIGLAQADALRRVISRDPAVARRDRRVLIGIWLGVTTLSLFIAIAIAAALAGRPGLIVGFDGTPIRDTVVGDALGAVARLVVLGLLLSAAQGGVLAWLLRSRSAVFNPQADEGPGAVLARLGGPAGVITALTLAGSSAWAIRSAQAVLPPAQLINQEFVLGQNSSTGTVLFNTDGSYALSTGSREAAIYRASPRGDLLRLRHTVTNALNVAAFSPADDTLAIAKQDGSLELWPKAAWSRTGLTITAGPELLRPVITPLGTLSPVVSLQFDPRGVSLLAGYQDGTLIGWASQTPGRGYIELARWKLRPDRLDAVAIAGANGQFILASSDLSSTVMVWTLPVTGSALRLAATLVPDPGEVIRDLAVTRDGKAFVTVTDAGVRGWTAEAAPKPISAAALSGLNPRSAAFSPDGRTLAVRALTADGLSRLLFWDVSDTSSPSLIGETIEGTRLIPIGAMAWRPDGNLIASSGSNTVNMWRVPGRPWPPPAVTQAPPATQGPPPTATAGPTLTPARTALPTVMTTQIPIRVSPLPVPRTPVATALPATPQAVRPLITFSGLNAPHGVAFSPSGGSIAVGLDDPGAREFDTVKGAILSNVHPGHHGLDVVYTPDGRLIIAHGADINVFGTNPDTPVMTLTGHTGNVVSLAISKDGKILASGSDDNTFRVWDLVTGRSLKTVTTSGSVSSVAISPDGKTLVAVGSGLDGRVWDVASLTERNKLELNGPVAISSDGQLIASGGNGVTLSRASDGATVRAPDKFDLALGTWIRALAISPDGKLVASVDAPSQGDPNTLRFWRIGPDNALTLVQSIQAHDSDAQDIAFSPDGTLLATSSSDNSVKLWNVPR